MTKIYFCIKLFRSLKYGLSKIFCLKLPDILVNLGKFSTGRSRNLTGNLHHPVLISAPKEGGAYSTFEDFPGHLLDVGV